MITQENLSLLLIEWLPWCNGLLSVVTAYLLSNQRVLPGRIIGTIASIFWLIYGIISSQYAFLFTQIIFLWIYISAIIKFTKKRNEYKALKVLNDDQKTDLGVRMEAITEIANKIKTLKSSETIDRFDQEHIDRLETKMYNLINRIDKDFH